jgi:hypothetical protein
MSRRTNLAVSVLAITTIFFGVRYAVARERLRDPHYLHWIYADENKHHFGDALPDAHLRSGDLTDHDKDDTYTLGVTYTLDENCFVIVLAPKWNTTELEARRTIQHEACHVATWKKEDDPHGPLFQDCMKRFPREQ